MTSNRNHVGADQTWQNRWDARFDRVVWRLWQLQRAAAERKGWVKRGMRNYLPRFVVEGIWSLAECVLLWATAWSACYMLLRIVL